MVLPLQAGVLAEAAGNPSSALTHYCAALSLQPACVPSLTRVAALTLALSGQDGVGRVLVDRAEGYAMRALRADAQSAAAWCALLALLLMLLCMGARECACGVWPGWDPVFPSLCALRVV